MQLEELGLVFPGGLGDNEERGKIEFHFREKRQEVVSPVMEMALFNPWNSGWKRP